MTEFVSHRFTSEGEGWNESETGNVMTKDRQFGDEARPAELFGRLVELSLLSELIERNPDGGAAVAITGDRGTGKTALLKEMAIRARSKNMLVVSVSGRENEVGLEGAALYELLKPFFDDFGSLSQAHERAISSALGISESPASGNRLVLSVGVLNLLSNVARRSPVLLCVDDSQWLDNTSREVLSFIVHNLTEVAVLIAFSFRTGSALTDFEEQLQTIRLGPISNSEAGRLLDSSPNCLRGRARSLVLEYGAGNPLALIEFARVLSTHSTGLDKLIGAPLPLSQRLTGIAIEASSLPTQMKSTLMTIAVAEDVDRCPETGFLLELHGDAVTSAEEAGVLVVDRTGPHFCDPLFRSALYHSATLAERFAAHERLAELLSGRPDRHAWHASATLIGPRDDAADVLENTVEISLSLDGPIAAAKALERAAELTSDLGKKSRRLVDAASMALSAGEGEWAHSLSNRALILPCAVEVRIAARRCAGLALMQSCSYTAAIATFSSVASDASLEQNDLAIESVGLAATAQFLSGGVRDREQTLLTLERVTGSRSKSLSESTADSANLLWARVATSSMSSRDHALKRLGRLWKQSDDVTSIEPLALSAWALDETELSVELCREALQVVTGLDVRTSSHSLIEVLGWACVDSGRWNEALQIARAVDESHLASATCSLAVASDLITATILAMRGEASAAQFRARRVIDSSDPAEARLALSRARHALGLAALGEADFVGAYAHLRKLFAVDGTPLHRQWSYLAIGDLAAAACRIGRTAEASGLIERAIGKKQGPLSPRIEQLMSRARALCANAETAEAHFDKAFAEKGGDKWPFERSQLTLDYAEWLRRRRRINESKVLLIDSLDSFRRLGAAPWAERAQSELRACGESLSVNPNALAELTSQQREIVAFAAQGLTNREIAQRMFISARTVSSHLYRSFPKLGISARHQLRDLVVSAHELQATQ